MSHPSHSMPPPPSDNTEPPEDDALMRFLWRQAPVRGEAVSLDAAWRLAIANHAYPPSVRRHLGELCAAGLLLAASLKFDGTLILQIHGDGPVALLVVECNAQGQFRATAKLRDPSACPDDADLVSLVNQHGSGRFVVTLDPATESPNRQPYQGIVAFEGRTVAEVLERYMAHSEQIPTRMWLAADDQRATGLLLQKLPEQGGRFNRSPEGPTDTDSWARVQHLAETLTGDELLATPYLTLIHRLFWQEPLQAFDGCTLRFTCRCSHAKVAAMLKLLGEAEINAILEEQGAITVHCDFCAKPYHFDAIDSARLFLNELSAPDSQARH